MGSYQRYNVYRVSTPQGGSIDDIAVDADRDTPREREHQAWCQLLQDERSPHYQMAMRLIRELGVDRTKAMFSAALTFERIEQGSR